MHHLLLHILVIGIRAVENEAVQRAKGGNGAFIEGVLHGRKLLLIHPDALRSANHITAKKNINLAREVSGSDCVVYGDYGRIRLQDHRGILEIPSGKQYNVKTK